jgi:hypothetical protein
MSTIDYHAGIRALVAVRGHPFDRTAFATVFEDMTGISATMVDQPAAALLMNPAGMRDFDALVLYDMPGLDFAPTDPPRYVEPDPALIAGFEALLTEGKGIVARMARLAGLCRASRRPVPVPAGPAARHCPPRLGISSRCCL